VFKVQKEIEQDRAGRESISQLKYKVTLMPYMLKGESVKDGVRETVL
jgi:hypothetical protein